MILRRMLKPTKQVLSRTTRVLRQGLKKSKSFITPMDIFEVTRLSAQGLLAWITPEPAWRPLSRLFARLSVITNSRRNRQEIAQIASLLAGTRFERDAYDVVIGNWTWRYEERFQYLRAWRPGGWSPRIDLVGAEHLTAALNKGHGIIFWSGLFSFNNLLPKIALHRLGLAVFGFSVPSHGFSASYFGVRFLNRVFRDIENLYLEERLMAWPEEIPAALQRMRDRLKANGVVHIALGGRARRTASASFLGGKIFMATGPIAMAHATGAALLPVYTLRLAPTHFEVTIGPPIELRMSNDNVDYSATVQAYADGLLPFVLKDPSQWLGWHLTRPRAPWGGKRRIKKDGATQPAYSIRSDRYGQSQ